MNVKLVKARIKDIDLVVELLNQNDLPYQDIRTAGKEFFLAYDNSSFIGCIGLETFNSIGLLRSMVVKKDYQNKDYGKKICNELIDYAKKQDIQELYLLTTTAKNFFEKIGFEIVERNIAPDAIKNTIEFTDLCPASAVCLKFCLTTLRNCS